MGSGMTLSRMKLYHTRCNTNLVDSENGLEHLNHLFVVLMPPGGNFIKLFSLELMPQQGNFNKLYFTFTSKKIFDVGTWCQHLKPFFFVTDTMAK
jgi:hypothetical protein